MPLEKTLIVPKLITAVFAYFMLQLTGTSGFFFLERRLNLRPISSMTASKPVTSPLALA